MERVQIFILATLGLSAAFLFLMHIIGTKKPKPPPIPRHTWEQMLTQKMVDEPEEGVLEYNNMYDNADSDKLLDAKMQCLEWAIKNVNNDTSDKAVEAAQKYWDFMVLEKDDKV